MADEDVEQMLDDCESAKDVPEHNGGPRPAYDDWEREFLESVRDQHSSGRALSAKQVAKLRELWDRF